MAGVMSLMQPQGQQGPMPGQASQQAMPGMMPQQGAPTPQAVTGSLKNMPLEQLRALYQNPQPGSPPLWAVISALAEKQKEAQAMMAARGQSAMAQNAQMQQQPPVAAQVVQAAEQMQDPVMAAYGGEMHSYAGGGAVAFQYAGYVPPREEGESFEDYRQRVIRFQDQKLAEEKAEARRKTEEYYAGELAARKGLARPSPFTGQARPVDTSKLFPFGPPESPMMDVPEIQIAPSPAPTAGPRRQTAAAPAPAPAAPTPSLGLQNLVDLDKAQKEELERIQGRQAVDPTVAAARAAERKGAEEIAAGRQTRAEAQRTEAQRQLDETLKRGRTNIFQDPEALLRIAAGIDTRRGKGLGSLAGGFADIMGQRRAEATAARKDFQTAQNAYNQEMNALDTLRQLQRERDTAIATGDVAAARAIQDQITNVNRFYQKAKEDRQNAERSYQLDLLKTQATQDQARAALTQAGKPTDAQSRIALYRSDPKAYEAMYGSKESASVANLVRAVNSDPRLKKLAESILPDAEAQYNARYKELVATYAPELLLGAGGGGGGGALEAATAIARGGK